VIKIVRNLSGRKNEIHKIGTCPPTFSSAAREPVDLADDLADEDTLLEEAWSQSYVFDLQHHG
jgi:hypothetical protein